jgi:HemY protein
MKWLWILLALILGAIAGTAWLSDPGFVLIRINDWLIETSAAVAILALLGTSAVVGIAWQLLRRVFASTSMLADWQHNKTVKAQLELQQQGLVAVLRRGWGRAEKILSRIDANDVNSFEANIYGEHQQFTHLMLAAYAAHARGDASGRNNAIRQIEQLSNGGINLPAGRHTLFAQWYLESADTAEAVALLKKQTARNKKDSRLLSLLLSAHVARQDWAAAEDAWAALKKMNRSVATGLRLHAYEFQRRDDFGSAVHADTIALAHLLARSSDGVKEYKGLVPGDQRNPQLVSSWVNLLVEQQRQVEALDVLELALDHTWVAAWLVQWLQLAEVRLEKSLRRAQSWLTNRPNDAQLLEALGQLTGDNGQWNDAKGYFEAALKAPELKDPDKGRLYQQLGAVWHALGDEHRALQYFVQAQALASH